MALLTKVTCKKIGRLRYCTVMLLAGTYTYLQGGLIRFLLAVCGCMLITFFFSVGYAA